MFAKKRQKKKKKSPTVPTWKGSSDWMGELPKQFWNFPLNHLAIPGSHNSFSYSQDKTSVEDRNLDPVYRHCVDHFGPLAAEVSQRWTVTQTKTITEQLDLGVRYLDLRVVARQHDDTHVYFRDGLNIVYALKEIDAWTDKHPKEVVLLDFTETLRLKDTQHKRYLLGYMTKELFKQKMLSFTGHTSGITLRNMWALGAQIIVFYPFMFMYDYTSVWPQEFIGDVATTGSTPKHMIDKLEDRYQQGRHLDIFFRWMGVLLTGPEYLEQNAGGTLRKNMSEMASRAIVNWVKDKDIQKSQINIVVADFVELNNFCREVVKVNFEVRQRKKYDFEIGSSSYAIL